MSAPVIVEARPGVLLAPDAALSFRRAEEDWGLPIPVNSAYRDYWHQMSMWQAWQRYVNGGPHPGHARALHPDQSMHCRGLAIDTDMWRVKGFIPFMEDRGWIRTAAWDPTEQHHFDYQWWRDNHRGRPAGGNATPFPEEDPMPTLEEIAKHVWHGLTFRNGRTPGQELVRQGDRIARLELQVADLGSRGTGRFFKHGGRGITLWVYVQESGDFVRIRDLATAQLYKQLNGTESVTVTGDALRLKIADLTAAGGRDLSAVVETLETVETPEIAQVVPDVDE